MNSFQTVVLGIFGFFIIAGLIVIATVKTTGGTPAVQISMWGSAPSTDIQPLLEQYFDSETLKVSYTEFAPESLDNSLVEALASGTGPDMVILPAELLVRYRDKIVFVPYTNYSDAQFRESFTQGAELFLEANGISALPFSVDPLLMYYNRDMLEGAGIVSAPKYWDEFLSIGNKLTKRDGIGNISRSAVALGEYRNIDNAKEILTGMFQQSGNAVVAHEATGRSYSVLEQTGAVSVLDFYTEFANPLKPSYSWNRAQVGSRSAFLSSRLAVYFGFGSEYNDLRKSNPNLNFTVAHFPNPRTASVSLTYGKFSGLAVLKSSRQQSAGLAVALTLSSASAQATFGRLSGLPPVRRDLLASRPTDTFGGILYDASIRARGFFDPNPTESVQVFQDMVESITSGKSGTGNAISQASSGFQRLIR
ncbi:MAG: hypothetical protein COV91_03660 [Candidatus Taylorbacteria bacterium CG11_big_fil_rev_8_21_14_0_20_46_11]|uniref:ABC transporter substrate-binding protein n=1 Tax=Candidatus Taylorbacteria bacterium CG11_big_fil_rev_8_21_14_0_20_46_11 TaxID=1975025 RepID=A0A2H0KDP9_9BACT|nr:MAG: hypothetical protein COV91_03660 [Candidatus Taylorbacteria bacterium CG11_big_fil_rev_8_21_14_0_20_46_11]